MKNLFTALATLTLGLTILFPAQAATLKIGDPAPPLQSGTWVQGEPVASFDSNHVYIVEFWATWCGPCRASIPHLNEVWQKFKDKGVIVIGQDVWEQDDSGVPAFIRKMGDKMTYRVALDDKSRDSQGAMAMTWMKAAGQNGIPTAFVVDHHGKIAWIGHPMGLEDAVLDKILADKFDSAAYAQEFEQAQKDQALRSAISLRLRQAIQEKNWDMADAAMTELEKTMPPAMRYQLGPDQVQILLGRTNFTAACTLAESLSEGHPNSAVFLNELAWTFAIANGVDQTSLALAEKLAERASEASGGNQPAILDTLARVQFLNGKTNEAVATEQKALDAAPDEAKDFYRKFIDAYRQGILPRLKE